MEKDIGEGRTMKTIITTGYMGSGSSAITDLLSEFSDIGVPNDAFEYIFLHCPNGVFDLEDKLLLGNNALRSDEAIHSFIDTMKRLYNLQCTEYWPAGYKTNISADFLEYIQEFLGEIGVIDINSVWYYQDEPNNTMRLENIMKKIIKRLTFNAITLSSASRYNGMKLAFPNEQQFYRAAQNLIKKIFLAVSDNQNQTVVFDQLFLPHNLWRLDNYLPNNCHVFVVDRDPRDVFLLNKYIWPDRGTSVPYPDDVEKFCTYYERVRQIERIPDGKNILRMHFEDLIYHYDDSLQTIYRFLGENVVSHTDKMKRFDPQISINNTQLFSTIRGHEDEVRIIENRLKTYLYDFPSDHKFEPDTDLVF